MSEQLAEELHIMRAMAIAAGDLLLQNLGRLSGVDYKAANELVTDLDRRAEELLLKAVARHFPADTAVAEEGGKLAGNSGRTWYIDPLDGTTNYVHGHPFFSISLAVAESEKLVLGVVYAPYLDEMYLAGAGAGARLERPRLGLSRALPRRTAGRLQNSLLATGFPYRRDELVDRNTEYLRRFLHADCHGVRRGGSAALDLAHLAAGVLDGYWEMRLRPWDVAAGTLLAREAGCTVTDLGGQDLWLSWEEIVAAVPDVHESMLAVLNEPVSPQDPRADPPDPEGDMQ